MPHTLTLENPRKVKKAVPVIEKKIKIKISVKGDKANLKGEELNEFIVAKILRAVDFGFDVEDALLLKKEDYCLEFINIKEHTRRKRLGEVRGRVIGTEGKAKKTIEELTGGVVVIHDNEVGLIVDSEHLEAACQAICSLIQGSKHGNVFSYLERQNAELKKRDDGDLGLKEEVKERDGLLVQ